MDSTLQQAVHENVGRETALRDENVQLKEERDRLEACFPLSASAPLQWSLSPCACGLGGAAARQERSQGADA
jgi:hypothetical protein